MVLKLATFVRYTDAFLISAKRFQNAFFRNLNVRGDLASGPLWKLRGLGFSDRDNRRIAEARRQTADTELVRVQAQIANDAIAAFKARVAVAEAMNDARESVTGAIESLQLNLANIRRRASLPGAARPIEVLKPIQAQGQVRAEYLT